MTNVLLMKSMMLTENRHECKFDVLHLSYTECMVVAHDHCFLIKWETKPHELKNITKMLTTKKC